MKMLADLERVRQERALILAVLTCCVALLFGLAATFAGAAAPWVRGGLGLVGLVLLGLGSGLLVAHLVIDERRARRTGDGDHG